MSKEPVIIEFKKGQRIQVNALQSASVFCATIGEVDRTDFFADEDEVVKMPTDSKWEDVAVLAGIFPSKGQARKNQWGGEIPAGWSEKMFGKRKKFIFIHKG